MSDIYDDRFNFLSIILQNNNDKDKIYINSNNKKIIKIVERNIIKKINIINKNQKQNQKETKILYISNFIF